ncbi:MAG: hypothetical protein H7Y37_16880 [Anaerolineae bacterium]|nr:hypothetical protein [Gloeobacterales cyanobacterium ES-bin-313]
MKLSSLFLTACTFAAVIVVLPVPQAQAGFRAGHTQNGAAVVRGNSGQYGQSGCASGARYGVSGGKACASSYTGPNGNSSTSTRATGYKAGVGAATNKSTSYTGANGNTYDNQRQGTYNAQTGQGAYTGGKSGTYNGTAYGVNTTANGTKGQGGTVNVDSVNNGSGTCTTGSGCVKTAPTP